MAMSNPATNRRKSRIVLPSLQGQIILQTTLLPLIALGLLVLTATFIARQLMVEAATMDVVFENLQPLLVAIVCMSTVMAGSILYVAFRFSHRIAGPAYRLVKSLEQVQTGNAHFQVKLRDGDLLTELAVQMNLTLESLQSLLPPPSPTSTAPAADQGLAATSSTGGQPLGASAGTVTEKR
jgi:sensor histidine kinase YesM